MSFRLTGVVCPIATPLDDDERLDGAAMDALVDRILPSVDGIFALGSSGEYALLRNSVADAVIDRVVDRVAGRVPIAVGVGDTGTTRAIDNVRRVARSGVDAVVVSSGFYYPVTDHDTLVAHFLAVAEASTLPVIIYNIPQNTASPLALASVGALAEHPNVAGIKDSSGDMFGFTALMRHRSEDFFVMQGREQLAAASSWLGADGVISALANLAPGLLHELLEAVRSGQRDRALDVQARVTEAATLFDQGYWLSALKAALAELGIGTGRAARPLPPVTNEQRVEIRRRLAGAGLPAG